MILLSYFACHRSNWLFLSVELFLKWTLIRSFIFENYSNKWITAILSLLSPTDRFLSYSDASMKVLAICYRPEYLVFNKEGLSQSPVGKNCARYFWVQPSDDTILLKQLWDITSDLSQDFQNFFRKQVDSWDC